MWGSPQLLITSERGIPTMLPPPFNGGGQMVVVRWRILTQITS